MSNLMDWACLSSHAEGVLLRVRATPNAARTAAEGLRGDRLSLRVKAPPVEGKANEEVCKWAAKAFKIRVSAVSLLRGARAREKDLLLAGVASERASQILGELLGPS